MDISAKTDYAIRALLALAAEPDEGPISVEELSRRQGLPRKFLEAILGDLRKGGLVASQRGPQGGYTLASRPEQISLGEVFRVVGGPLAEVRGLRPQHTSYTGAAEHLPAVWVAVRASLRSVLDETTLADVLSGSLPDHVRSLVDTPDAWSNR